MGFGHNENEVGLVDYFSGEKLAAMTERSAPSSLLTMRASSEAGIPISR